MAITLDVVTRLNDTSARTAALDAQRHFDRAGGQAGANFDKNMSGSFERVSTGADRSARKVQRSYEKAYDGVVTAAGRVRVEQEKLDMLISSRSSNRVRLIEQQERLANAHRLVERSTKTAGDAYLDMTSKMQTLGDGSNGASQSLTQLGTSIMTLTRVAAPVAIVGLGVAIADLAAVAASASQSLWLLPAAAGAAGAAFGTLKLATMGFGDAIGDIGDPEKFAEDLQKLSPAAQQAALAIQAMMPAFTQLKNATQDALFAGMGEQLNSLSNQYLPAVQQMTTGIAGAFNQMASGAMKQLTSSDTFASMSTVMDNIAASFRALEPAAAPFTKAIADIMAVGSGALPQIARAVADAATQFSNFITNARQSGQLQQWLSDGLDALKQLGGLAKDTVSAFAEMAPTGKRILPEIVSGLRTIVQELPHIVEGASQITPVFAQIMPIVKGVGETINWISTGPIPGMATALGQVLSPLKMMADLWDAIATAWAAVTGKDYDGSALDNARKAMEAGQQNRAWGGAPMGSTAAPPGMLGGGSSFDAPNGGAGIPGYPDGGYASPVGGLGSGIGAFNRAPVPGGGWAPGNPFGSTTGGGGGSGAGSSAPAAEVPYGAMPGITPGVPLTASVYSAQTSLWEAQHAVEEKRARLQQLQADNTAKAEQRIAAENDVAKAEREQHEAQMRFQTAQKEAYESQFKTLSKTADQLGEVGAQIDQDFGISDGLPGIAENLTKFLANLAAAPVIGALSGVQQGLGFKPGEAGSGLFGMGAGSGLFGSQYMMAPGGGGRGGGGYPGYPGMPGASSFGGDAALLARVPGGRYDASGDLSKGLGDCSSAVEDLVNIMDGRPTAGRQMSTGNAAEWLTAHGFMPGSMPGAFNVGYNAGHMQATLPGGTNFNWGSDAAAASGGVAPNSGAFDPSFTSHYYRPVGGYPVGGGGIPMPTAPLAPGGYTPLTPSQLVDPGLLSPTPSALGPAPLAPPAPGAPAAPVGPGWMGPPLSTQYTGGGGHSPVLPTGQGPTAGGLGGPGGVGASAGLNSQLGSQGYGAGSPGGSGFGGMGGLPMAAVNSAISAGGLAIDAMAPGAGQVAAAAAQTGIQLANRAIGTAGQAAGIAVGGLLETFLPNNSGRADPSKNWIGRIAGGISGARPSLPNTAGKAADPKPPGEGDPNQPGSGQPGQTGDTKMVHIENMNNYGPDGQTVANDVAATQLSSQVAASGGRL